MRPYGPCAPVCITARRPPLCFILFSHVALCVGGRGRLRLWRPPHHLVSSTGPDPFSHRSPVPVGGVLPSVITATRTAMALFNRFPLFLSDLCPRPSILRNPQPRARTRPMATQGPCLSPGTPFQCDAHGLSPAERCPPACRPKAQSFQSPCATSGLVTAVTPTFSYIGVALLAIMCRLHRAVREQGTMPATGIRGRRRRTLRHIHTGPVTVVIQQDTCIVAFLDGAVSLAGVFAGFDLNVSMRRWAIPTLPHLMRAFTTSRPIACDPAAIVRSFCSMF